MSHYALICGGRTFGDRNSHPPDVADRMVEVARAAMFDVVGFLAAFYGKELRILHGGARGADSLAGEAAEHHGVTFKVYPADWDAYGRRAGIMRNERMASNLVTWMIGGHSAEVIGFPGGPGTFHMLSFAQKVGLSTTSIPVEGYTEGFEVGGYWEGHYVG